MERERVGVLLSHWYEPNLPANPGEPRRPNIQGRFRADMAVKALEEGLVDRLIVLGGMPDNHGFPVEVGQHKYAIQVLQDHCREDLGCRVSTPDRSSTTTETLGDLKGLLDDLRANGETPQIVLISNRYHLKPRGRVICSLLGIKDAEILAAEDILEIYWGKTEGTEKLKNAVVPTRFKLTQYPQEAVFTALLLIGHLPGMKELIRSIISKVSKVKRAR